MPKATDKCYKSSMTWLKRQYDSNPEFRAKILANNAFQNMKIKLRRLIDLVFLEQAVNYYFTKNETLFYVE
jgi:hypothetical protein